MSEEERINIIRTIRDEINMLKDYLDVKYSTKIELDMARKEREVVCQAREEKLDKKFKPIYAMLVIILLFLATKYGAEILSLITRVV